MLVADGDSSTFANLVAQCSWIIKKCNCCNHFHKCCRSRLEKAIASSEFREQKWHIEFPSPLIVKLCKSLKAACRMARITACKKEAEIFLRHDLNNAVWHCLGYHEECRVAFCGTARQLRPNVPVPPFVNFRVPEDQIGKLGTTVKTFLGHDWEGSGSLGPSMDACKCNTEGDCVCDFNFPPDNEGTDEESATDEELDPLL